jgi:hypothetical protein
VLCDAGTTAYHSLRPHPHTKPRLSVHNLLAQGLRFVPLLLRPSHAAVSCAPAAAAACSPGSPNSTTSPTTSCAATR